MSAQWIDYASTIVAFGIGYLVGYGVSNWERGGRR